MIYRKFEEDNLSMLGMGCMRFPCVENGEVDMHKTAEMTDLCIKNGVNYFDTAWFYHNGKSEEIMGEILSKYPRKSYYLATKMPWTELKTPEDAKRVFEKQLKNTKTDYFDYYLLHNVSEDTIDIFTDDNTKVIEYLCKERENGRIRHLGFSSHADLPLFRNFIEKYGDILEFCQIQLNWLDWTLQNAKEKVEILSKYNIPIWVMEPVRGGKLANLTDSDKEILKSLRPDESIASWSFRFLQGIDGVKMVLSGMSNREQVEDNIKTFSEEKPLTVAERDTLFEIADRILSKKIMTCTKCKYCITECPMNIDIPKVLGIYNDIYIMGMNREDAEDGAACKKCIACGCCEQKCPQGIKISEIMQEYASIL